jgi:hypothetical protein
MAWHGPVYGTVQDMDKFFSKMLRSLFFSSSECSFLEEDLFLLKI